MDAENEKNNGIVTSMAMLQQEQVQKGEQLSCCSEFCAEDADDPDICWISEQPSVSSTQGTNVSRRTCSARRKARCFFNSSLLIRQMYTKS